MSFNKISSGLEGLSPGEEEEMKRRKWLAKKCQERMSLKVIYSSNYVKTQPSTWVC